MDMLKTIVIYLPGLLCVGFAALAATLTPTVDPDDPLLPWRGDMTTMEFILERRGLAGDAAVGLLAHLVIYLSTEDNVRVTAKLFYAGYLATLLFTVTSIGAYARTEEGAKRFKASAPEQNFGIVAGLALVNIVGAFLLSTKSYGDKNKAKTS